MIEKTRHQLAEVKNIFTFLLIHTGDALICSVTIGVIGHIQLKQSWYCDVLDSSPREREYYIIIKKTNYESVSKSFGTESITKYTLTTINTR
jgi:hypothetical protein